MKVEIVSKETIKPSSPTPQTFKLCVMDQVSPPVYTKLYFFYQNTSGDDFKEVVASRTERLRSSLSQMLTLFYPFAGGIRDQLTVTFEEADGAEFVEARVDSTLEDYLRKPTPEMFKYLVPGDFWEKGTRPLLMIQASFFTCGGLCIGMNFSHKVSDAGAFTHFISSWADTAIGKLDSVKTPDFCASQVCPPVEELYLSGEEVGEVVETNDKTIRLVFTGPKIEALQEKAADETVQRPSRMEAIITFIWRIGMRMSAKRACVSSKPSVLITPVNTRRSLRPPISDQTFGNLVESLMVRSDGGDTELPHLISLYRDRVKEWREAYAKGLSGQEFMERFMVIGEQMMELMPFPDAKNAFTISSWSKFPFYEADFGWGKPIWVATHNPMPYVTILMDTRDMTGIEAWVNLPEEQMAIFASDGELLTYATPNASAL